MKRLIIVAAAAMATLCNAPAANGDTVSMATAPSGITVVSDSVVDNGDTVTDNYVVSANIPKALPKMLEKLASEAGDGLLSPARWVGMLMGMFGGWLLLTVIALVALPAILLLLLVWLLVRGRRRAKREDQTRDAPNAGIAADGQDGENPRRAYESHTRRRANAIRNMCVGGGVALVALITSMPLIAVGGAIVLGVGVADYLAHRDKNNTDQ